MTVESSTFLDGLQLFHSKLYSHSITISVERAKGEVRTYRRDLLTALHELMENAVETLEDDIDAGRQTNGVIALSSNPVQKPRAESKSGSRTRTRLPRSYPRYAQARL